MSAHVLELRVPGVSNSPPENVLGIAPDPANPADHRPPARRVAGDQVTGFYRSSTVHPGEPVVVEAYSWGQLTSGARAAKDIRRALWTLLLPYALSNLALHARPDIPADPRRERWTDGPGLAAFLVRLFCLSLTVTFVLATTGAGVDLFAWQCVDAECLGQIPGPWEFLGSGWWSDGARSLVVGLLAPLGVLALVGFLTWRTYHYEAELPADPPAAELPADPPGPAEQDALDNPLQDPTFWCGEGQIRRLAVLHLASGAAVAAVVPLGAVAAMDPPQGARHLVVWPTVAAIAAPLVLSVAALAHPSISRRDGNTPIGPYGWLVAALAGVGVLGTTAFLLLPDGPAGTPLAQLRPPVGCIRDQMLPGCAEDRSLPGYDWVVAWLGTAQVLLLIALGGVARVGRRALAAPAGATLLIVLGNGWSADWLPDVPPAPGWAHTWMIAGPALVVAAVVTLYLHRTPAPPSATAWGGRGPAVLAGLGWLLGLAYSAGVLYWLTDRLNRGATPTGRSAVTLPVPVMWAGLAIVAVLLIVLVAAVRAGLTFARLRREGLAELVRTHRTLTAHERVRARDVASYRALHRLLGEHLGRLVGQVALVAAALAAAGTAANLSRLRPVPVDPTGWELVVKALTDLGDSLAAWLPVLVAGLGLMVYRNDSVRRSVGVVWDIVTFWPRAAHPFAPPCYAERAVPQLQTRMTGLLALPDTDRDRPVAVLLSGHSQGSVISAAVILQLAQRWRSRIWFFSAGSQLGRLYGPVFPAYFGPHRLPALTSMLGDAGGRPRWTNLWRETDPIGWPVGAGERQVPIADPAALRPSGGEVADPPIRHHSGYPDSPEYQRERAIVVSLFTAAMPSPRAG
ncbi:MAG TPA: hypothetical protein VHN18_01830 [Micromonosporaceae bacterium]|nr:hypothetical protein [Micromonosporaceae bacterium]